MATAMAATEAEVLRPAAVEAATAAVAVAVAAAAAAAGDALLRTQTLISRRRKQLTWTLAISVTSNDS